MISMLNIAHVLIITFVKLVLQNYYLKSKSLYPKLCISFYSVSEKANYLKFNLNTISSLKLL